MEAEKLEMLIDSGQSPLVLDVRSDIEFKSGHIQGAFHSPLGNLLKGAESASQSKRDHLILVCEHGPRAQVAKMLLKLNGYKNIELLNGHMSAWRQSGRTVDDLR